MQVHYEHCDVIDIAALKTAIENVRKALGPITILVNNAAHDQRCSIDDVTPSSGTTASPLSMYGISSSPRRRSIPDTKTAGGGAIVNYSSSAWLMGAMNLAAYSTAKAGVLGLTNSLARDLQAPHNIRVNAIIPGWIMTKRQLDLWLTPEAGSEIPDGAAMPEAQAASGRLRPHDLVSRFRRCVGHYQPELSVVDGGRFCGAATAVYAG